MKEMFNEYIFRIPIASADFGFNNEPKSGENNKKTSLIMRKKSNILFCEIEKMSIINLKMFKNFGNEHPFFFEEIYYPKNDLTLQISPKEIQVKYYNFCILF